MAFSRKAKENKVSEPQDSSAQQTASMNALVGHQHRPALIGTLSLLAASSIFLFAALRKKKKNEKNNDSTNKKRHRRRISFTSVGLGVGSFPPSANVKEPIINAAIYFDNADLPLTKDVARIIVEPLLAYERLSHVPDLDERVCRPSERRGKGKDGEAATAATGVIDPADMIRVLAVKGDEDLVNRTILEHCQDPLGEGRDDLPWWEILVIRNGSGSGPSACVVRVHHVIGDGLALVAAFDRILTKEDGTPIRSRLFQSRTISSASDAAGSKTKKKKTGILSTIWSLAEATGHCLTLAATRYDDDTAFSRMNHARMKHSGRREAVIFPTVPLDFVKELKTAAGGGATVNDVLTTAVSQAIRDYCISRDDEVLAKGGESIRCRGLMPVGFPRSKEELGDVSAAMRNAWCMVSCDLGVGHSTVKERLRHVRARTTEMKEKPRAYVQLNIQNNLGPYIPLSVGQQTVFDTFSRHSLVLTNVPGPSDRVLFAGKKVRSVQLFFDNLLTQVDLISYAGNVYGNIVFDADQLPDAEKFGRLYVGGLVALAELLGVHVPPEVRKHA